MSFSRSNGLPMSVSVLLGRIYNSWRTIPYSCLGSASYRCQARPSALTINTIVGAQTLRAVAEETITDAAGAALTLVDAGGAPPVGVQQGRDGIAPGACGWAHRTHVVRVKGEPVEDGSPLTAGRVGKAETEGPRRTRASVDGEGPVFPGRVVSPRRSVFGALGAARSAPATDTVIAPTITLALVMVRIPTAITFFVVLGCALVNSEVSNVLSVIGAILGFAPEERPAWKTFAWTYASLTIPLVLIGGSAL
ncbi:hypothetical protein B0H17DRAFT_1337293 [Mycena rosella]|uniref:Uncharacterized protein n=1 Tax=Mycena rosella TaxID=1033263 RepID=A0AAD7G577_MYCRO|nr:hypothetical protein B0H17DRAFT_1337293 [Mycena rosella]